MTCSDVKLTSPVCSNQNVLINSLSDKGYESLSNIPRALKKMTECLTSVYQLTLRNSMKNFVDDLRESRLTVSTDIKEFCVIAVHTFRCSTIGHFIFTKWIKDLTQKRMDALENNEDDLIHAHV